TGRFPEAWAPSQGGTRRAPQPSRSRGKHWVRSRAGPEIPAGLRAPGHLAVTRAWRHNIAPTRCPLPSSRHSIFRRIGHVDAVFGPQLLIFRVERSRAMLGKPFALHGI